MDLESREIILSSQQKKRWGSCSAPLIFAYAKSSFSQELPHIELVYSLLLIYEVALCFSISCMPGLGKHSSGVSVFGACFECLHLCKSQSMTVLETEKEFNELCMSLE